MGLFDSVVGNMLGGAMAGGPLQALVGSLVSGQAMGGLPGLVEKFSQAGLGNVIGSWIGNGQNLPIDPDALHRVLGSEQVQEMAERVGVPKGVLLETLSKLLPPAVDQATPNGQLPDNSFDAAGTDAGAGPAASEQTADSDDDSDQEPDPAHS